MKPHRILIITAAIVLAAACAWLVWPLTDERLVIVADERLRARKNDYLSGVRPRRGPNIILLLADDLSVYDVSRFGGTNLATPNIDAIGAEGVTFTRAYCTSPICAPSRSSLLTGRYHQRTGFELQPMNRYPKNRLEYYAYKNFILPRTGEWQIAPLAPVPPESAYAAQGMPSEEISLPEILSRAGFATACIGKWHLGYGSDRIPTARGFRDQYGFYEAFTLYAPVNATNIVSSRHTYFSDRHMWAQERKGLSAIRKNGVIIDEKEYLTFAIAREVNDHIRTKASAGSPFFLYAAFNAPHTPFQVPVSYYDKFRHITDHNRRVYYAMISALDDAIGSITRTLSECGLDENTLVFFASDNGAATYAGVDNLPLRQGKFTFFEGGVRVPMMMRWKGHIAPRTVDAPVSLMDIYATSMASVGIPRPKDRPIDGVDLSRLENGSDRGRMLFWRTLYVRAAIRDQWKIIVDDRAGRTWLYDIGNDPGEHNDRAAEHPDVVNAMKKSIADWERGLTPARWPRVMDFRYRVDDTYLLFPL
ncbi:MAG: sulfatase-like hydrolase/transferase [Spirochaetota bacterium]